MLRISRVFVALALALPLWANPHDHRVEKGEFARLNHVHIQKPETNSYMNATVAVTTMETDSGPRPFADIWITEGSYTYPYRTMWANIYAFLPDDAFKVTGKTALLEHDFTGNPTLEVTAYEYDVTGYVSPISYQPGQVRLKFAENGIQSFNTIGNGAGYIQNLRIRWSGQHSTSSATVIEGMIFGTVVPATDNATMGTSHTNYLERTRSEGPFMTGPGAPPAAAD